MHLALSVGLLGAIVAIGLAMFQYDPASPGGRFLAPDEMSSSPPVSAGAVLPSGEKPIQRTDEPTIAALALRYQPTVVVSAADRFWPVSVLDALRMRWQGHSTCLYSGGRCRIPRPAPTDLSIRGSVLDYLQYPTPVDSVSDTFSSVAQVLGLPGGGIRDWLRRPGSLDPFPSAQIYFYHLGRVPDGFYPGVPAGLLSLQYWFYYPLNYLPLLRTPPDVIGYAPLLRTPLDALTQLIVSTLGHTDYHQGDLEHVAVLLDPHSMQPRYLWMARHGTEGQAYRWHAYGVQWDGDHAFIYEALGSHASYAQCGIHRRGLTYSLVNDYVMCVPKETYAFDYRATPLVDLAHTGWGCWRGRIGEAGAHLTRVRVALIPYETDGPRSPLWQQENAHLACR